MNALIGLVCRAHPERHELGPLITRVEEVWAYCEGNGASDHDWRRIQPIPRDRVGELTRMEERQAS